MFIGQVGDDKGLLLRRTCMHAGQRWSNF